MSIHSETHILSLDIGTSSVRCKVYNAKGEAVESIGIQTPYSMTRTADGGEFIDANDLFQIIVHTLDQTVEQLKAKSVSIQAVSCCTFLHNVVGVNENRDACTPLLNWSDTRPETILPELNQRLDAEAFTRRTGCPMHASFLPAKITWLHHAMPDAAKKVRFWMSFGEYFHFQITGQRWCSYSMASGSGLLDSANCVWDEETLNAIPADVSQLSELCDKDHGIREIKPEWKQRWEWLSDALWFPALGDGTSSNIGCGCSQPGRVALMVGTSGAMRVVWRGEYREPPEGLWCYRIDKNRPVQGGALSNGGNLFAWMNDTLNLPPADVLEKELVEMKPDSHGLTMLPFLSGQRSPRWNPNSRGAIHGLRLSTQPIQILQAGLEAIAYRFKLIHSLLVPILPKDHIIVASGGGLLKSPAWIQIMADVIGYPICVSQVQEASCRGTALAALESLGILDDISSAEPCFGDTVTPAEEAHQIYQAAFQRHIDYELANHHPPLAAEN